MFSLNVPLFFSYFLKVHLLLDPIYLQFYIDSDNSLTNLQYITILYIDCLVVNFLEFSLDKFASPFKRTCPLTPYSILNKGTLWQLHQCSCGLGSWYLISAIALVFYSIWTINQSPHIPPYLPEPFIFTTTGYCSFQIWSSFFEILKNQFLCEFESGHNCWKKMYIVKKDSQDTTHDGQLQHHRFGKASF